MTEIILAVLLTGSVLLAATGFAIALHERKKTKEQGKENKEAAENAQKKKQDIRTGDHSHDVNTMADIMHEYASK